MNRRPERLGDLLPGVLAAIAARHHLEVNGEPPVADLNVPMSVLSQALDEIFELRTLLAYEAAVREADLELKTFPKSRRDKAEWAVTRMRAAANGERVTPVIRPDALRLAREKAGMPHTLTRALWEAEKRKGAA